MLPKEEDVAGCASPMASGQVLHGFETFEGTCERSAGEADEAVSDVAALTPPRMAAKGVGLEAMARFCCRVDILAWKRVCLCALNGFESDP